MRSTLPTDVPPYFWTMRLMPCARSHRAKHERRVRAAESEGVRERDADGHPACDVRHEIEIALRILPEEIRGRRRDLVAHREHGEDRLDATRRAEQVTRH